MQVCYQYRIQSPTSRGARGGVRACASAIQRLMVTGGPAVEAAPQFRPQPTGRQKASCPEDAGQLYNAAPEGWDRRRATSCNQGEQLKKSRADYSARCGRLSFDREQVWIRHLDRPGDA